MTDRCASNGLRPLRNPGAFISFKKFGGQNVLDFQAFFYSFIFRATIKGFSSLKPNKISIYQTTVIDGVWCPV